MDWYFKLVANRPLVIIAAIGTFSIVALVISVTSTKLPDFSDPQLGFETRGTEIAKRLTTWDNLYEAVRLSGSLTVNPLANKVPENLSQSVNMDLSMDSSSENDIAETTHKSERKTKGHNVQKHKSESKGKSKLTVNKYEEDEDHSDLDVHTDHDHNHLSHDGFFCDGLNPDYSHLVVESVDSSASLLSVNALHSICTIQENLMNTEIMNSICQTITSSHCCNPWSLPNYIALLYNHSSCFDITEGNVNSLRKLLRGCSKYYHDLLLTPDCYEGTHCHGVPRKCKKFNAVYNILYYLIDVDFLPENESVSGTDEERYLNRTMIFLPIARSSAILPYYYNLTPSILKHDHVQVSGMDFGLKNSLFNDCLVKDAFLMVAGLAFMILCIWTYTNSLLITISTILAVIVSLIISYFVYTFVFAIKFFPFMNVLAVVVAIGIGADDVFIFDKIWRHFDSSKGNSSFASLVANTLKHSATSMFVTSLTTAAAFYSTSVSSITAINCFSVFAGTAVLTNFLLMVTWLPACYVVSQRDHHVPFPWKWRPTFYTRLPSVRIHMHRVKTSLDNYLVVAVTRLWWLWLLVFTGLAVGSAIVVLHHPKLRLPDSRDFHLFQSSHLFERYDLVHRDKFWFEKLKRVSSWDSNNFKLPLRFVWGLHPVDNGNHFEPDSKGTLEFDPSFDMADPESQEWLLNFCRLLRSQPFYQSTQGPLLSNCFVESFKSWMQRRCKDAIDNVDRTPCCESSEFPYKREVFETCIVHAIESLYETPSVYFPPGVAGPKFSKFGRNEIKVVVIEYDSNQSYSMSFQEMHDFYTEVETWFREQLLTAPAGMRNAWFISHLGFYDLQLALSNDTSVAIAVSMAIALVVFFLVSLNLLISIYTVVTISCTIFVTVGLLVLIGWRLNVLESVAVTTAIGLAVDFSLHYGMHYSLSGERDRKSAVAFTLNKMGGPTLMAALTTGAAGFFMLPSSVLAYIQIGVFLLIVMTVSWLYSTVFLMSLLSVIGPEKGFGQFSYRNLFSYFKRRKVNSSERNDKGVDASAFLEALPPANIADNDDDDNPVESHEVKDLTRLNRSTK